MPVTTADAEALRGWDEAVGELVAFAGDPLHSARVALDADPGFAEARALGAYLQLYAQTLPGRAAARVLLDAAATSAGSRGRWHLEAAHAWADGELGQAARCLEGALLDDPHDLLALRVVQDLYFFLGDGRSLRDSAARVVRQWSDADPGWGWVQGIYSFGLEEAGEYRRAEGAARTALGADPADVWAVHTMAHIAEMEGRPDEGLAEMLGRAPQWSTSFFAVHNWWHVGLYRIANGELDEAVTLYDTAIRGGDSEAWLDLVDAASLLWRLALCGVDVTGRAAALVGVIEPIAGIGISAFNDWHATMVFGLAGRQDLCGALLAGLGRTSGSNADVVSAAGRPVIEAFARFADGDFVGAAETLFAVRPRTQMLGGSHAQRDAIDLTLLAAAASAGDAKMLRALVDERMESRPGAGGPLDRLIGARAA